MHGTEYSLPVGTNKVWKSLKKCLTEWAEYGILIKSSARTADNTRKSCEWRHETSLKKLEKSAWQSENDVISSKSAATSSLRCVPCKLNNVTNTKHQKDLVVSKLWKKLVRTTVNYFFEAKMSFNKIDLSSESCLDTILLRVWSWLRMNAGGVLNTCKSNGAYMIEDSSKRL